MKEKSTERRITWRGLKSEIKEHKITFAVYVVLRVIGIAYVAQFGAELCRDAGESAVASKIEFAGKIIIMTLSMPIMYKLLEVVNKIIQGLM